VKPSAAELRRYEGSTTCTGNFTVLSVDNMDECTPYLIPAPASIYVNQTNETAYASYHFQGPTDCSGNAGTKVADWLVGECVSFDGYSQMRDWITAPPPAPSACGVPGVCGRAYQVCCAGSAVTGNACACHLNNGTGKAGSRDCGKCGNAFVECCSAAGLTGHGCTCDIRDNAVSSVVV
jgi:hypothetical protein